ncbi:MAG: hypothetical protein HGA87_04790 [Desulfobulbaceae bacterium]|nr:hypothetical protein [Desulfobulbaceae bacterium]
MTVAVNPLLAGVNITSSVMLASVKVLYGFANSTNDFVNNHIDDMQQSEKPTISRTGRVLEMAKHGFGIGYITPIAIIAAGQLILGNSLSAVTTVASAATLTNPIAMTCAAVGAIYYGWNALSDEEKSEMLEKLSNGLSIGAELIKSIIRFVIDKTKELWNSENLAEIKRNISSAAEIFGKTLGDVTHKISDKLADGFDTIKEKTAVAMEKTADLASDAYEVVREQTEHAAGHAAEFAADAYDSAKEQGGKMVDRIKAAKSSNEAKATQDSPNGSENHLK